MEQKRQLILVKPRSLTYGLMLLFAICFLQPNAQNIEKLKLELKQAKHDTARCVILEDYINEEPDEAIWNLYNNELLILSYAQFNKHIKNPPLRNAFLKHLSYGLLNKGYIYHDNGNVSEAIKLNEYVLSISDFIKDNENASLASSNIGKYYSDIGNTSQALISFLKSLKHAELSKDSMSVLRTLNNMGALHAKEKNYTEALSYYNKAIRFAQKIKNNNIIATMHANIGNLYLKMHQRDSALVYFRESLLLTDTVDNPLLYAKTLFNIGEVYDSSAIHTYIHTYIHTAKTYFLKKFITSTTA